MHKRKVTRMNKYDLTIPALKEVYEDKFLFGNIMSPDDFQDEDTLAMYKHHYNAVTAENIMKPVNITAAPGEYDFTEADRLVNWAVENNIKMIGHTLIWHGQSAPWLNRDEQGDALTRSQAKVNMESFIKTYVSRYEGNIYSWDVINEMFRDIKEFPGNWRDCLRQLENKTFTTAHWYLAYANGAKEGECGSDYVFDAFYYARKYAPSAKLVYNDYNEEVPAKREAIAQMVEELNAIWKEHPEYDGRLLVECIGMQAHCNQDTNLTWVRESLERFSKTGARIAVTELDATFGKEDFVWNPNQPPSAEEFAAYRAKVYTLSDQETQKQVEMYTTLFKLYLEYAAYIDRVTMWGKNDQESWRKWGSPTFFDAKRVAKDAFWACVNAAK